MTLAPIRGAPPGAPNPDFPIEEVKAKPVQPTAMPASGELPHASPRRQPYAPIEIGADGNSITFRVIAEIPAIMRPSMTIHANAGSVAPSSFLRMSAANARGFLINLRDGRSPIVATGDEDGTVQIEFESTEVGLVVSVHELGQPHAVRSWVIGRSFDIKAAANELLADLGA
jgi:hypothetical protein